MSLDESTLAQELLQHEDFLRRLARGLVGAEAEDLVQDVWERAFARPPAGRGHVRGWLATVARNLARNRARASERRLAREESTAREVLLSQPTPDEVEERFELRRQVVQALDALEEPFRGTLILRYFEDLAPEGIAARQGVPLATVKSRLARGLAKLRAELDARHGGERETWLGGLAAWLRASPDSAGAGSVASVAAGGFLMGTMVKLVLGAAVLAAAGWIATRGRGAVPSGVDGSAPVARAEGETAPAVPLVGSQAAPLPPAAERASGRTESAAAEATPARHVVLGRIRGPLAAEGPEVRVLVSGIQHGVAWPEELVVEGRGRADGTYELDVGRLFDHGRSELELEELLLRFDHPRFCPAELRVLAASGRENARGQTIFTADVQLLEAAIVRGVLLRPDGQAASAGVAAAFHVLAGAPRTPEADVVDCAEDGSFVLRVHPEGSLLLALVEDGARPTTLAAEVAIGRSLELGAVWLEPGAVLSGHAFQGGAPIPGAPRPGAPLTGAKIELRAEVPGEPCSLVRPRGVVSLSWSGSRFERGRTWLRTDGDGAFAFEGLAPDAFVLSVVGGGHASLAGPRPERVVRAPAQDVRLESGWATLRFEFAGERGPGDGRLVLESSSGRADFTLRGTDVWTLEVPPGEDVNGSVSFPGCRRAPFALHTPGPGEEELVPIPLERGLDPARLVLAIDAPEGWTVDALALSFAAPGEGRPEIRCVPVAEGRALVEELAPGRYEVRVRTGERFELGTSPFLEQRLELELAPGAEVRRELVLRPGAGLRLTVRDQEGALIGTGYRLLDWNGEAVALPMRAYRDGNVFETRFRVLPFGVNEACPLLAPGRYELVLAEPGFAEERVPLELVAGETRELELRLRRE